MIGAIAPVVVTSWSRYTDNRGALRPKHTWSLTSVPVRLKPSPASQDALAFANGEIVYDWLQTFNDEFKGLFSGSVGVGGQPRNPGQIVSVLFDLIAQFALALALRSGPIYVKGALMLDDQHRPTTLVANSEIRTLCVYHLESTKTAIAAPSQIGATTRTVLLKSASRTLRGDYFAERRLRMHMPSVCSWTKNSTAFTAP